MPLKLVVAILLFFVGGMRSFATPSSLNAWAGYAHSPTQSDSLTQWGSYNFNINERLKAELGGALTESLLSLDVFEYKGEIRYSPTPFFEPFLRLSHHLSPSRGFSFSSVFLGFQTTIELTSWLSIYGCLGFYEKFLALSLHFPFVFSPAVTDNDFAGLMGARVNWSDKLQTNFDIATFDRFHAYNLHNPFARVTVEWRQEPKRTYFAVVRYKILLGFGRLDELLFLGGVSFLL